MADCSKTEVFFEEWNRLCRNAPSQFFCTGCECQKLFKSYGYKNCAQMMRHHAKELIEFVQKWSDEHPLPKPKTYADVFLENFPNAITTSQKTPIICRNDLFGKTLTCVDGITCDACWNEPYPEQVVGV